MRHVLKLSTLLLAMCVSVSGRTACAQSETPPTSNSPTSGTQPPADNAALAAGSSEQSSVVEIPLVQGSASSADVFHAVADQLHWVSGTVALFTRSGNEGERIAARLTAAQVDELVSLLPEVFSYRRDAAGQPQSLLVDQTAMASLLVDKKSRLRTWLAGVQRVSLSKLTKVESTWGEPNSQPLRLVVTLAGVHSLEASAEAVARALHEQTNLPMLVFEYPNDAPVTESAARLASALEGLHREYPRSRVTLVAHSLGGLVARAAIELVELDGGASRRGLPERTGVDQLIQVCPPNHGSALAEYAPLLEGLEQAVRLVNRGTNRQQRQLLRMITDGFNEASRDLEPDSELIHTLDRQHRHSDVRYTILAGDAGPLRPGMTRLLDAVWETVTAAVDEPPQLDQRIRELLEADELQQGRGDGVVSLERAKLEGVADFVVLPMHHLSWSQLESPAGQRLVREISRRLGISL